MSRPEGEPTHWLPLWRDDDGDFGDCFLDCRATADEADDLGIVPDDRVTVAPEPYTPKAGDRVRHRLGGDLTLISDHIINDALPCIWHNDGRSDTYGVISADQIVGPA